MCNVLYCAPSCTPTIHASNGVIAHSPDLQFKEYLHLHHDAGHTHVCKGKLDLIKSFSHTTARSLICSLLPFPPCACAHERAAQLFAQQCCSLFSSSLLSQSVCLRPGPWGRRGVPWLTGAWGCCGSCCICWRTAGPSWAVPSGSSWRVFTRPQPPSAPWPSVRFCSAPSFIFGVFGLTSMRSKYHAE